MDGGTAITAAAPVVAGAEAIEDIARFDAHPHRRYRQRQGEGGTWWIGRRRSGRVMLRTRVARPQAGADSDDALRPAWFRAAWPALPAKQLRELIKTSRATRS